VTRHAKRPETAHFATGACAAHAYAAFMSAIAQHQLEILRRVRAGQHLGGGDVPLASLQEEIDRLQTLRLIEPAATCPYRLTQLGVRVFAAAAVASTLNSATTPR